MSNESGIRPVEYKVLILPEEVKEKTKGGIILPGTTKDREEMAQVKGVVVGMGGNAFEDWKGTIPGIGSVVYYGKYAGYTITGEDGKTYRLINDKDVCAVIER